MNRAAWKIEWSALRFELRRMLRMQHYKFVDSEFEWTAPVLNSLIHGLLMGGLAFFLVTAFYWETIPYVYFMIFGAMLIANKAWKPRNPQMAGGISEFIATCGFSRQTWYRASLLAGFWISLLYGAMLGGLYIGFGHGDEFMVIDRAFYLKASCSPLVTGLVFLIHLSWETDRRLRCLRIASARPRQRIWSHFLPVVIERRWDRSSKQPLKHQNRYLLLPLALMVFTVFILHSEGQLRLQRDWFYWLRYLFMYLIIIGLGKTIFETFTRRATSFLYPGMVGMVFVFVIMVLYRPEFYGLVYFSQALQKLPYQVPAIMAVLIVGFLLILASRWVLRPSSRDLAECESPVGAEE